MALVFLQVAVVYLFVSWLEGPNAPTSMVVTALFVIVAVNVARVNGRIDALLALLSASWFSVERMRRAVPAWTLCWATSGPGMARLP